MSDTCSYQQCCSHVGGSAHTGSSRDTHTLLTRTRLSCAHAAFQRRLLHVCAHAHLCSCVLGVLPPGRGLHAHGRAQANAPRAVTSPAHTSAATAARACWGLCDTRVCTQRHVGCRFAGALRARTRVHTHSRSRAFRCLRVIALRQHVCEVPCTHQDACACTHEHTYMCPDVHRSAHTPTCVHAHGYCTQLHTSHCAARLYTQTHVQIHAGLRTLVVAACQHVARTACVSGNCVHAHVCSWSCARS